MERATPQNQAQLWQIYVSGHTFGEMVEVLRPHLERQGQRGGQNKLSTEDQLLVTLAVRRGSTAASFISAPVGDYTRRR